MHANTTKRRILAIFLSVALSIQCAPVLAVPAISANIHLSPETQIVTKGNTFTIAIGITTSSNVKEVEVNLSYPSSQVAFQDVSYSGSSFSNRLDWTGGGGNIRIVRSSDSLVTGELPLAVLTFKVAAEYGTGTIRVLDTSTLKNGSTPISAIFGSATIDFGSATPPSTQPKPTTTFTRLASPSDPRFDATPPVLSNIQSKQIGANTVAIAWTTNEPSSSKVEYGLDTNYGLTAEESLKGTGHSVTLRSAFLQPNGLYHYRVTSVDASGNTVHSTDFVFTTRSVLYAITVKGSDGKPLPRARVTLNGQTAYTENDGKAFLHSSAGEQALTVSYNEINMSKTVTIAPDKSEQIDSVKLAAHRTLIDSRYIIYPALVLAGLLVGIASRAYLLKYPLTILRRKKNRFLNMTISSMQMEYGDKNPAHNPYQVKRMFSFWGVWNSFVDVFRRPSKKVSKKIREEVKAAGLAKKSSPNKN